MNFNLRNWLEVSTLSQIQQELNELLTVTILHFSNRIGQQNDPNQMVLAVLKSWKVFSSYFLPTFLGVFLPVHQLEDIDLKKMALLRFRDQILLHSKDKLQGKIGHDLIERSLFSNDQNVGNFMAIR